MTAILGGFQASEVTGDDANVAVTAFYAGQISRSTFPPSRSKGVVKALLMQQRLISCPGARFRII